MKGGKCCETFEEFLLLDSSNGSNKQFINLLVGKSKATNTPETEKKNMPCETGDFIDQHSKI